MKTLITGITGFAGIYLTEELENNNFEVTGTYYPENTHYLFKKIHKNVKIYFCDIRKKNNIKKILIKIRPDIIYHLAAVSSVGYSFDNPVETFSVNVGGTLNLLESCVELKLPVKFIYISSSEIYGKVDKKRIPITETETVNPVSPYSISKYSAEFIVKHFFKTTFLKGVIVRPFNHVGKYQNARFVLPSLALQLNRIKRYKKKPVIRVGNLNAKRDFTDVRDVVRAYRMLGETDSSHTIFNVGSGKSYSINTILKKMCILKGIKDIKKEIDRELYRQIEIKELKGSYKRLNDETGWNPEINIEDTLKEILGYYI